MAKKTNYTNYSKNENKTEVVEEIVEQPVEEVEVVPEPEVEPEPEAEEVKEIMGVVAGCDRLNVRADADSTAEILNTLAKGTKVQIDEAGSTKDFYKIYTASGIEGYCMKQFITIQ